MTQIRTGSDADPAGLDGLVVGIPAARKAADTAALVERFGGRPLVGPTVDETSSADADVAQATSFMTRVRVNWSVHLTGTGTRRWIDIADRANLKTELLATLSKAHIVARGPKTRTALREFGLEPVWMPSEESSHAIAEWLAPQIGIADMVVVQRHGDPVPQLIDTFCATGARVAEIAPYRWDLPADLGPAKGLVAAVASGEVDVLLITSGPQLRHLLVVADQERCGEAVRSALAERVFIAAVGEVAASGISDEGLVADLVAYPYRLATLVRSVAAARDQVLAKRNRAVA